MTSTIRRREMKGSTIYIIHGTKRGKITLVDENMHSLVSPLFSADVLSP